MKVLFYIPTPGGLTGAPRRLLTLISCFRDHKYGVVVSADEGSELLTRARELGYDILPIDPIGFLNLRGGALFSGNVIFRLRTGYALLRQNFRFQRLVRKKDVDVVWTRGSKGIVFSALGVILSRRPLVWDVDYELPSRGVVRWLHRFGLRVSKAVVFQYQSAPDSIFGKQLADHYRHKFTAIIPGIDLFALDPYRSMRMQRVRATQDPFVILQVGTVCDRKNQLLTVEALRLANEKGLHWRWELWLAYDAIQDPEVVTRVQEYGLESHIRFLGWRDDVKSLMTEADILVMPSKDEGVPNAVQEAMAIGLPVVVSKAGGMPEIVTDGVTGWVVGIDDLESWSAAISRCAEEPAACEMISSNAVEYAVTNFGTDNWGEEYAKVIKASAKSLSTGDSC